MIYFIKEIGERYIKIGYTSHDTAVGRLSSLQVGNPRQLIVEHTEYGDTDREWMLHRLFASYRISGEWFEYVPAIRAYIKGELSISGTSTMSKGDIAEYMALWEEYTQV